jgi:hypothetical protein
VSRLVINGSVSRAEWHCVAAALDRNRCHGFMRHLELPALHMDASAAAALLTATNGLVHLRSLQCGGAGANTVLDAVGGRLRRLALPDCTAAEGISFAQMPLLRCVGAVRALPASVAVIDLSHLQRLTRIGDHFGCECDGLRDVRLPPSVTAIGDCFLYRCRAFAAVLDLSPLTQLQRIGGYFAADSPLSDLRLPSSVTAIGDSFLFRCTAYRGVLDLSHLTSLQSLDRGFAAGCAVRDVRLPSSVRAIGRIFLSDCGNITDERKAALLAAARE